MGRVVVLVVGLGATAGALLAQESPSPSPSADVPPSASQSLAAPEGLRERIVEGKLRLSLEETIRLALANDTGVRLGRLGFDASRYAVDRARSAFDPVLNLNADDVRANSPAVSQLDGADTREDRERSGRVNLTEVLPTATRVGLDWTASRASTNSIFSTFNPSYSSNLTVSLTQPLLGVRGPFATRAPLRLAKGDRERARAEFTAFVNDSVARAVDRYWAVVQLREGLGVLQKSLDLAENTYKQNKRALELGALPPLDIFRSEAQVATRRAVVIQSQCPEAGGG